MKSTTAKYPHTRLVTQLDKHGGLLRTADCSRQSSPSSDSFANLDANDFVISSTGNFTATSPSIARDMTFSCCFTTGSETAD